MFGRRSVSSAIEKWQVDSFCKTYKPLDFVSVYRPICLLDGCGKLLDYLTLTRLRKLLVNKNAIADNQCGFRRIRSLLDALVQPKHHSPRGYYRKRTPSQAGDYVEFGCQEYLQFLSERGYSQGNQRKRFWQAYWEHSKLIC